METTYLSPPERTALKTIRVVSGPLGFITTMGGVAVLYSTGMLDPLMHKIPEALPPNDPIYTKVAESSFNADFGFVSGVPKRGTLVVVDTNPQTSEVTFMTAYHVVTNNDRNATYGSIGGILVSEPKIVRPDSKLDIALVTMEFINPQDFKKYTPIPKSLLAQLPDVSAKQNEVGVPSRGYKSNLIKLESPVERIQKESIENINKLLYKKVLDPGFSGSMVIDKYGNDFLVTGIVTQAGTRKGIEYTVVTPLSNKVLKAINSLP